MPQPDFLKFARYYSQQSWPIFPCRVKDKVPAVRWADEATTDYAKIERWWTNTPEANIGMVTGAKSGLVVLDVDKGHGGMESLMALQVEHGRLPDTWETITGGGGRHILFKHPGVPIHNSAGKLGPGLDIRGDGGYIVVPPSIHPSGNVYTFDDTCKPGKCELAAMPNWLVNLLKETAAPAASQNGAKVEKKFAPGTRNQSLTSLAGTFRRRGMDEDEIFTALMAVNVKRCDPPLTEKEVRAIAASVKRYIPAPEPVVQPEEPQATPQAPQGRRPLMNAFDGAYAFIDLLGRLDGRVVQTWIPPIDNTVGGNERQTLTVLAARPSMGKSTLAWQIARNCAANGLKVVYFSLEMSTASLWAKASCGAVGISWTDMKAGRCSDTDIRRVSDKAEELAQIYGENLLVDDSTNSTTTILDTLYKHRPDVFIVDHLRLVTDKEESEVQRLGIITQRLKDYAKDLNCAGVCLAQLNRQVEGRAEHRPTLSDLRDSGQIEENADLVLMMYRPDYYQPTSEPTEYSLTELLVAKYRDGAARSQINLAFDKRHQFFAATKELSV